MMSPSHSHSILPPPGSPGSSGGPTPHFPGPGLPQSPPPPAPPQVFGQGIPMPPTGLQGQPPVFHQNTNPHMNQQGAAFKSLADGQMNSPFQAMSQMPSEFFKSLFSIQPLGLAGKNAIRKKTRVGYRSGQYQAFSKLFLSLSGRMALYVFKPKNIVRKIFLLIVRFRKTTRSNV